jgi:nicotinamidase-related amidase
MRLPADTVLLVVDVQCAIDAPVWGPRNNPDAEHAIAALIAAWREAAMPIVHVRHDSVEPASPYRPGQHGHAFKDCAAPAVGEEVVAKTTGSAFVGTDLEERLAAAGRTTLVACGVLTHNSLATTVRHAGCLGYRVFVPEDACWAVDQRDPSGALWPAQTVHALALTGLQGEYAGVTTTQAVLSAVELTAAFRRRKDRLRNRLDSTTTSS